MTGTTINDLKKQPLMPKNPSINCITMLGSLPPLRALSSYCLELSQAVAGLTGVEFISFKSIYPSLLYPGGKLKEDHTFPVTRLNSNIKERRYLTWYNPLSWVMEGILTKGRLLHAQWWSPPLLIIYAVICLLYKIRGKPVVITVHNIVQHEEKPFHRLCSRTIFKLGDHFIVHSGSNKKALVELFNINHDRVSVIHHGPLSFHNGENINRREARLELGLNEQDPVILLFGAVRPYKGAGIALEALFEVLKEIPEARLIVAGKLWESWEKYEKIVRKNNISEHVIKHLYYIDSNQVAKYFVASDLVILPYLHFESQSGVGSTAVAFRKPMIVTETGGLPELVADRANVVPAGNIKALAERIVYCLNDDTVMKKMSEEADRIADKISWDSAALETLNIYKKLLYRNE